MIGWIIVKPGHGDVIYKGKNFLGRGRGVMKYEVALYQHSDVIYGTLVTLQNLKVGTIFVSDTIMLIKSVEFHIVKKATPLDILMLRKNRLKEAEKRQNVSERVIFFGPEIHLTHVEFQTRSQKIVGREIEVFASTERNDTFEIYTIFYAVDSEFAFLKEGSFELGELYHQEVGEKSE